MHAMADGPLGPGRDGDCGGAGASDGGVGQPPDLEANDQKKMITTPPPFLQPTHTSFTQPTHNSPSI